MISWTLIRRLVTLSSLKYNSTSGNVWILIGTLMVNNRSHSNREIFHGENDNASEGYILGTGIATSAMLPLLVLSLATILLNLFRTS